MLVVLSFFVVLLMGSRSNTGDVHAFSLTTTTTPIQSSANHQRRSRIQQQQRQFTTTIPSQDKNHGLQLLQMIPDPESSSTITNSLLGIGETLAVGNIVTATLLFGAGVVATLKRGEESSSDDKALKEKVLKAPQVEVGYQTEEDSTVEVVEIKKEEEETSVEPVRVRNQQTETPLEKEVVEDLLVKTITEEDAVAAPAVTKTVKQDFNQLKKDVSKTVAKVQDTLETPVLEPIEVSEKDITRLKTEIGNTLAKEGTAGIKRGSVSKEDLKDIKDQVQESLNVASGNNTKKPSKRRFVVKLVKKIVMPWKAWKNL